MTDNNHPITPPPELVQEWIAEWSLGDSWAQVCQNVALVAARWGADQELEACCKLLELSDSNARDFLTAARRPKPPSLKEQALAKLPEHPEDMAPSQYWELTPSEVTTIRRALETLPDD